MSLSRAMTVRFILRSIPIVSNSSQFRCPFEGTLFIFHGSEGTAQAARAVAVDISQDGRTRLYQAAGNGM